MAKEEKTFFGKVKSFFRASPENPQSNLANPSSWFIDWIGGSTSNSGVEVNQDSSLTLAAVWACNRVIAESIASIPLNVYRRTPTGKELATDHPLFYLLHNEPNEKQTSFQWRETAQTHVNLTGNAYTLIERKSNGEVVKLPYTEKQDWTVRTKNNQIYYFLNGIPVYPDDVFHLPGLSLNGLTGLSTIGYAREAIGLGLATQIFGNKFFGNGARLSGVLEHPATLSDQAYARLQNSWSNSNSGLENAHKTKILEEGMKYTQLSVSPEEAQFILTRKFNVNDICRIFRVPPHMVADLEKSAFSNIEQQSIDFVTHTIRPWAVRWEQEINRKLFKVSERGQYFAEFNLEGLLRGDAQSRAEFYNKLFQMGSISPNEIRTKENMNTYEGGDQRFVQLNMIPVEQTKDYYKTQNNNPENGN